MIERWLLAAAHLLALGIGLGAILSRAGALRRVEQPESLRRALIADAWWGIAALLWISTGLLRAFAGYEKGAAYYMGNQAFWIKMSLFLLVLLLEIAPAVILMRWRLQLRKGGAPDTTWAGRLTLISYLQALAVALMVFAATAMARGFGM